MIKEMFKSRYNLPSWAVNFHNDLKFISQSSLYKKERNAVFFYRKSCQATRNSVTSLHGNITIAQHCQFSSSSSSAISWRMERSAMPSCHDFVIKFLRNCWLGLLTPFCRSGFLKNLHRVGNVPVLVVSGRACKKRRLLREQVSCKVYQNMRWKRRKIQMVKVLIFSSFSTHILINVLIRLNIYVAQFL